jgi:hypothetical protein
LFNLITHPDVHFAWEEPLWYPDCVEQGPGYVETSHKNEPADGSLLHRLLPAVHDAIVGGGGDAGQAKEDEDTGAKGPETN